MKDLTTMTDGLRIAIELYTKAHILIRLARAKWPDQRGGRNDGTSLTRTFCELHSLYFDTLLDDLPLPLRSCGTKSRP